MEQILELITCPLTKLYFKDPVLAEDGLIYEYDAIKIHLLNKNTSPVTFQPISKNLIRINPIKKYIDYLIQINQDIKLNQFVSKKSFPHLKNEINIILNNKQYDKLFEYNMFQLNYKFENEIFIEYLCKNKNIEDKILKYIIDNSIDYDSYDISETNDKKLKPIHTACKFFNYKIVKFLIEKKIDLNSDDNNNNKPINILLINFIQNNSNLDIFNLLLDANINLNFENKYGYLPIHYIIKNSDIKLLELFLEYNIDLNIISKFKLNILQYSFKYSSNLNFIKKIIDLKIPFKNELDPKITNEQLIYQNDNLNISEKQQLVFYYLKQVMNTPIIVENYFNLKNN